MFNVVDNKGFQIEFSNGYTVSCQFGTFNYCSKRSFNESDFFKERHVSVWESPDCELAVLKGGDFITGEVLDKMELHIGGDDMVVGWVSADDVAKIIAYVSMLAS